MVEYAPLRRRVPPQRNPQSQPITRTPVPGVLQEPHVLTGGKFGEGESLEEMAHGWAQRGKYTMTARKLHATFVQQIRWKDAGDGRGGVFVRNREGGVGGGGA